MSESKTFNFYPGGAEEVSVTIDTSKIAIFSVVYGIKSEQPFREFLSQAIERHLYKTCNNDFDRLKQWAKDEINNFLQLMIMFRIDGIFRSEMDFKSDGVDDIALELDLVNIFLNVREGNYGEFLEDIGFGPRALVNYVDSDGEKTYVH